MSCNCNNINNKCADNGCSCGIFIDIYEGITLLHTIQADYVCDCDGYSFTFNEGSINNVFHEDDREVTVRYNTLRSRWEMVYYDEDLEGYIPFALYYTKDSSCPDGNNGFTIGSCGWDDNRNVSYVKVNSVVVGVAVWDGTRTNGYKVYRYYPDEYPGTYTDPFKITFDTATDKWVVNLNGVDIAYQVDPGPAQLNFPNGSFTAISPFSGTIFLDTYNSLPPTPGNVSPSGNLNIIKVRNIDCGCCDESVLINLTYNDILYTDIVATVVRDEYGNVIAINNYQYYTFELDSEILYLYYTGSSWMFSDSLTIGGNIYAELLLTNNCPFGSYLVNDNILCNQCLTINFTYNETEYTVSASFYGTEEGVNIYFYNSLEIDVALIYDQSMQQGAIYVFVDGMEFNVDFVSDVENAPCPFSGTWTPETEITNISVEQCGNAGLNITSFRVRGSECFDCCDYYRPGNRNLLKKKKAIFVDEISSIRNKEIFGFKCGTSWDDLFRKHLIFDVLNCLPYGVICDEEEQCLIKNLNENCNC